MPSIHLMSCAITQHLFTASLLHPLHPCAIIPITSMRYHMHSPHLLHPSRLLHPLHPYYIHALSHTYASICQHLYICQHLFTASLLHPCAIRCIHYIHALSHTYSPISQCNRCAAVTQCQHYIRTLHPNPLTLDPKPLTLKLSRSCAPIQHHRLQ